MKRKELSLHGKTSAGRGSIDTKKIIEELSSRLKSSSNGNNPNLSSAALAARIFEKAPEAFLERRSIPELAKITSVSHLLLENFLSGSQPFTVNIKCNKDCSTVQTFMEDRPFIINTLIECIRKAGIDIEVLLHPVLNLDGVQKVSLTYIELSPVSSDRLKVLKTHMENCLEILIRITSDFNSMLETVKQAGELICSIDCPSEHPHDAFSDVAAFLKWLCDYGFLFIGVSEWKASSNGTEDGGEPKLQHHILDARGIFKTKYRLLDQLTRECSNDVARFVQGDELLLATRLTCECPVQRREKLLNIVFRDCHSNSTSSRIFSAVGLITSRGLGQEASMIPFLGSKISRVLEAEGAAPDSHDYKSMLNILNGLPKEELMMLDVSEIQDDIQMTVHVQTKFQTQCSIRYDKSGRGVSVKVVMPYERFNEYVKERVQSHVEAAFGATKGSAEYRLNLRTRLLAVLYFRISVSPDTLLPVNLEKLETEVSNITRIWDDRLASALLESSDIADPNACMETYRGVFPRDYQALQSIDDCIQDIMNLEQLSLDNPIIIDIENSPAGNTFLFNLIVYKLGAELTISHAVPILEKAGLSIINEKSVKIRPHSKDEAFIHRFSVRHEKGTFLDPSSFRKSIAPGLVSVFNRKAASDVLNSLLVSANLDIRAISVLRTYCSYLWQISDFASRHTILDALAENPWAASHLWYIFDIRFNPKLGGSQASRSKRAKATTTSFQEGLRNVPNITQDRILRSLANILQCTVRTNFYSSNDTIAIKISSKEVELMPEPKPLFEIFVHSPRMEGIHLRGGRVARGGIRWSDRNEDFRSEILGLMKTQIVKNSLIVPTGSKGGFVLSNPPSELSALREAVENTYAEFVRALLSVTDNRTGDSIKHPKDLIIYDEPDPYLVIAADKGTATFSDLGNKIAVEEYDFWLGDAFASGGSNGYDHKLYGITARGAWECAVRHFNDLGIDYKNETFTAIGIGDMSGDVFGNGLIITDKIKLLAAFNHKHIFVDPDPDPGKSFAERKRLFELEKSQWSDYNPKIISKGGGVFGRFDKEITLTRQMRAALSIPDSAPKVVNGERLIRYILRTPCDLLWNGGIGTYVKASSESNADVVDGTNDSVRVNASEIRAKVVVEGGNLGFTQNARIEFDRKGGRINTDAIDNSGGVDLSDHEVNFKILLAPLVRENKLSFNERNKLLKSMAQEACQKVLNNNRNQALLLSLSSVRSSARIDYFKSLMRELAGKGYLNRHLDCLPDDEELGKRANRKQGLSRPELSVLLAAVKRHLKEILLASELQRDTLLEDFLTGYFPEALREKYEMEINSHPLAGEIITTRIINDLVDTVGATFVHRICLVHSVSPITAIKCYMAASNILDIPRLSCELGKFDTCRHNRMYLKQLQLIYNALYELTSWLVNYHGRNVPLHRLVEFYKSPYQGYMQHTDEMLVQEYRRSYLRRLQENKGCGMSDYCARSLAVFPAILPLFEILWASKKSGREPALVTKVYSEIMQELDLVKIMRSGELIKTQNEWESELLLDSFAQIRRSLALLSIEFIERKRYERKDIKESLNRKKGTGRLKHYIRETRGKIPSVVMIGVISRRLKRCVKK